MVGYPLEHGPVALARIGGVVLVEQQVGGAQLRVDVAAVGGNDTVQGAQRVVECLRIPATQHREGAPGRNLIRRRPRRAVLPVPGHDIIGEAGRFTAIAAAHRKFGERCGGGAIGGQAPKQRVAIHRIGSAEPAVQHQHVAERNGFGVTAGTR